MEGSYAFMEKEIREGYDGFPARKTGEILFRYPMIEEIENKSRGRWRIRLIQCPKRDISDPLRGILPEKFPEQTTVIREKPDICTGMLLMNRKRQVGGKTHVAIIVDDRDIEIDGIGMHHEKRYADKAVWNEYIQ